MLKYMCLNNISKKGLEFFDGDFEETKDISSADAILVRSYDMKNIELHDNLEAIARAGAGVNNIPVDECSKKGIVVFNTPGANANAVKELVIAGMLLSSRDIVGGISWINENKNNENISKDAESNKKKFAGFELSGKSLGIIGLGAIGIKVANAAIALDMNVFGYDPYISIDKAWQLSRNVKPALNLLQLLENCDFISIHVPLNDKTCNLLNENMISKVKKNAVILNFSRDVLVDEKAVLKALDENKMSYYVTDFPNNIVAGHKKVLVTPHLGASTAEAEENCAIMAVEELNDYMLNGNIHNSVNFPNCDMGICETACRLAICHRNKKSVIAEFTKICGEADINILGLTNKSKGDYAYTIFDVDKKITDDVCKKLKVSKDVLKIRIL